MDRLLLTNLATNQAFDAAVRKSPTVEAITNRYIESIMFQTDGLMRREALDAVEAQLVNHFGDVVQPAARTIGIRNAQRVLSDLGVGPNALNESALRGRILFDVKANDADRLRIVQAIVNDKANTLDNRLAAYYLEPGARDADKVKQLRDLHAEMETNRRAYDADLEKFNAGDLEKRPRKPNLDFAAKMNEDVKQGYREQARRTGTDAETATFVRAGQEIFAWVTVNATDACPDCRLRQGSRGDLAFWDHLGRPGSGKTICGAACFCLLVPEATLDRNPHLERGLIVNVKGVLTSEDDHDLLKLARQ